MLYTHKKEWKKNETLTFNSTDEPQNMISEKGMRCDTKGHTFLKSIYMKNPE